MLIEMVGYAAIHASGEDAWRCLLCDGTTKFDKDNLCSHLSDFHKINSSDLRLEKDAFFKYPSANKSNSN